jgi:hypothetical protein
VPLRQVLLDHLGPDAATLPTVSDATPLYEQVNLQVGVDAWLAAELPLPDADARRALLRLYQGNLVLDGVDLDPVIERTDGVTAPFLRELLRKAALLAAEEDEAGPAGEGPGTGGKDNAPIRVTGAQLTAALDQLLGSRGQLTRVLLGGQRG